MWGGLPYFLSSCKLERTVLFPIPLFDLGLFVDIYVYCVFLFVRHEEGGVGSSGVYTVKIPKSYHFFHSCLFEPLPFIYVILVCPRKYTLALVQI